MLSAELRFYGNKKRKEVFVWGLFTSSKDDGYGCDDDYDDDCGYSDVEGGV